MGRHARLPPVSARPSTRAAAAPARQGPPAPAAVAEAGGREILLFTDATSDGTAELRAIDLRTRKDAWDAPLPLKSVSRSGVTVEGNTAFLGDADGNVYAVDVATGK